MAPSLILLRNTRQKHFFCVSSTTNMNRLYIRLICVLKNAIDLKFYNIPYQLKTKPKGKL
jgi:hypothetical protein